MLNQIVNKLIKKLINDYFNKHKLLMQGLNITQLPINICDKIMLLAHPKHPCCENIQNFDKKKLKKKWEHIYYSRYSFYSFYCPTWSYHYLGYGNLGYGIDKHSKRKQNKKHIPSELNKKDLYFSKKRSFQKIRNR